MPTPNSGIPAPGHPPTPDLLDQMVREQLRSDPRLTPPATVLVAVSGGADSVALLRLVAAVAPDMGLGLVVAHLDHGLRGPEGDADARFVAELAEWLGLPIRTERVDAAATARREKRSLEDAARRERRRFLEEARAATGAAVVALGHTRDDQAETLLLNLLRGAGPRGLGAMPARGPGALTRPLLGATRAELLAWLEAIGQPFRSDGTNADLRFTRNRIRHELLPRLRADFNPGIDATLARAAELFRALDAFLETTVAAWLADPARRRRAPGVDALRVDALRAAPAALGDAILRHAAAEQGGLHDWSQAHTEALRNLLGADEDGAVDLPGQRRAWRAGRWLYLAAGGGPAPPVAADWTGRTDAVRSGAELRTPRGALRVTRIPVRPGAPVPLPGGQRSALFDAAGFPDRLTVRPLRAGDRLRPLGAPGRRKILDLLADSGIPPAERGGWPVVVSAAGPDEPVEPAASAGDVSRILWVPGIRRGHDFPVGPDSRELIMLEWFGDLDVDI